MGRIGIDDLEDLRSLRLDDEGRAELFGAATECTFVFGGADGWPSGVIMSFLYDEGAFWLTATSSRPQARALASEPRVTLVVTNAGTTLPGRRMVAVRGRATVHEDAATKAWFLPRFTARMAPADPESFARLLDSPKRVVFRVEPVAIAASHDSRRMPGDGRGGAAGSGSRHG